MSFFPNFFIIHSANLRFNEASTHTARRSIRMYIEMKLVLLARVSDRGYNFTATLATYS